MGRNKICSKCKKRKLLSVFTKQLAGKYGVGSICKKCRKAYDQKRWSLIKAGHAKLQRNWRKTLVGCLRGRFYALKSRCTNPKDKDYKHYGGRGIKCKFVSSQKFVDYVINKLQLDPRNLEVDRIDNNGHYEPGNIQFVTHKENCNNRKR